MPCYVTVRAGFDQNAERAATMRDPGIADPDLVNMPVRVELLSSRMLAVDGEPRGIISAIEENGSTTFLVAGSTRALRNRERRIALAKASGLLQQLAATLRPLTVESEAPELVTEGLGLLCNWISDERESATTYPSLETFSREEVSKRADGATR